MKKAIQVFRQCEQGFAHVKDLKYDVAKSTLYNNLSTCYNFIQKQDSALFFNQQAINLSSAKSSVRGDYYTTRALIFRRISKDSSRHYYQKALNIFFYHKQRLKLARTYYNLSTLFLTKPDSALKYIRHSIKSNCPGFVPSTQQPNPGLHNKTFNKVILIASLLRKGELLAKNNVNLRGALVALMSADTLVTRYRKKLKKRVEKINALRNSAKIFELAISVIWRLRQQLGIPQIEVVKYQRLFFYFSERAKGNVLLDQVSNKNAIDIPIISLPQVQDSLAPTQALLEFVHSGKDLFVQVITIDKITIKKLLTNTTKGELYDLANEFRFASHSLDVEDFIKDSPRLYKQFISPISSLIKDKNRLLIVPTSELTNFPFEALTSNKLSFNPDTPLLGLKEVKYLMHDYIVTYHVSSTLAFIHQPRAYEFDYFGVGFKHFSHKSFADLKHSEQEIKQSATYFSKSKTYLGYPSAHKQIMNELNSRILHISTHGNFQNQYLMGLIFPKGGGQLDTLGVKDIYNMNITTELAILSGCDSGAGKLIPHEGVFGFTHAFLYSNTPSIIYSLWSASDEGSKNIMKLFYETLKRNGDRDYAKALTLAKRQYSKKYYLPAVWGNFVINSK
ncbi:CHAT domain-containing protein [Microscilla marina]|uniref:CHAT domain-containing protein n=1 Tax=Microscilla marina TaxID=1027 RepID=UPI0018DC5387|nr:CHAT domain-containing protein [Microscilla marina]